MDPDLRFVLLALHIAGGLAVFASLGAILLGNSDKKSASILHGVSLVFVLLVGLHLLFSQQLLKTGGWWHAKLVIWLFIGAAPALAKRRVMPSWAVFALCLLAAAGAAFLGMRKPF